MLAESVMVTASNENVPRSDEAISRREFVMYYLFYYPAAIFAGIFTAAGGAMLG